MANKTYEVSEGASNALTRPKPVLTRANRLEARRTAYTKDAVLQRWRVGEPLHGEGNISAPNFAFVTMAPSHADALDNKRFLSGQIERVFTDMLTALDVSRAEVYITAICKWPTPQGRIFDSSFAMNKAVAHVVEELGIVEPKNVVLLGRPVSELFLPNVNMMKDHGCVARGVKMNFIPMFHPAAALTHRGIAKALINDMAALGHLA